MAETTRTRVAIIFGGVSSEHDVSCLTAGGVTRAIDEERFEVVGIGITPSGRWVQVSTDDMKEGTGAFLARRKPTFTGR